MPIKQSFVHQVAMLLVSWWLDNCAPVRYVGMFDKDRDKIVRVTVEYVEKSHVTHTEAMEYN